MKNIFNKPILNFLFILFISTSANADQNIYKCYDHSGICLICVDDSDYVYYKVKKSFLGQKKLFFRKNGKWKKDCAVGIDCRDCEQEITEDSFICSYPNSKVWSHTVFDLVSNTLSRVERDGKTTVFQCPKVK